MKVKINALSDLRTDQFAVAVRLSQHLQQDGTVFLQRYQRAQIWMDLRISNDRLTELLRLLQKRKVIEKIERNYFKFNPNLLSES